MFVELLLALDSICLFYCQIFSPETIILRKAVSSISEPIVYQINSLMTDIILSSSGTRRIERQVFLLCSGGSRYGNINTALSFLV